IPVLLHLSITSAQIETLPLLHFKRAGRSINHRLRGIVYHGSEHFTVRLFTSNGHIWFHDGIMTGSTTKYEGCMKDLNN
ncbi:hypothetical protein C8J57DRAFT_965680, partial [Mycena rebaudengoi]